MRSRWRDFELPTRAIVDKETLTDTYGRFIIEPFERGFGITIGNSLRRILLSSIEGSAVVTVKIDGVSHEFSVIPGIVEDVTDIILNIKSLIVKLYTEQPKKILIDVKKSGEVKGHDIITDGSVDIINKDIHIATLSKDIRFRVEMDVRRGRGYVPAEEYEVEENEIGVIPIDAIFSPIRNIVCKVEDTRVGHKTNYDRLIFEIWTNSVVSPEMALTEAAKILRKHLNPFVQYFELGKELKHIDTKSIQKINEQQFGETSEELEKKLNMSISEFDLSMRASNCLDIANIKTVRDLVSMTESQVLEIRNFGKTSLQEVKKILSQMGLSFGMLVKPDKTDKEVVKNET